MKGLHLEIGTLEEWRRTILNTKHNQVRNTDTRFAKMLIPIQAILLIIIAGLRLVIGDGMCKKIDDCSCKMSSGKVVSFKGLGTLETKDKDTDYKWKPCKSLGISGMKNVSAVRYKHNTDVYTDIGTVDSIQFATLADKLIFELQSENGNEQSVFACFCTNGIKTNWMFSIATAGVTSFQLHSPFCCPGYRPPSSNNSLSIGSIMVITFFVLLVSYLLIGFTYQATVKKANGIGRIPNVTFWIALPGLIREGFTFTGSKVCGVRGSYNQI